MAFASTLRLLFPTDFSPACVDAGRAIAPLVEARQVDVTTVHLVAPGTSLGRAREALDGFLGEIGGLDLSASVVREAVDAPATLARIAERQSFDLILSPSSGRRSLRRALVPSFRGQLLMRTPVPLWTAGSAEALGRLGHRVRNVACLMHWDHAVAGRVRTAAALATYLGARLHLLDVVPTSDDATLAYVLHTDRPLSTPVSIRCMQNLARAHRDTEAHAVVGRHATELRGLVQACEADVLLVSGEQARSGVARHRVSRHLDGLPCPIICLGAEADATRSWPFERPVGRSGQVAWAAHRFDPRRRAAA